MFLLSELKLKSQKMRRNLASLDDQPISKAALTVVIFLDLFILGAIFDGLADHTRQLESPNEVIPPICRSIVIDQRWNETNYLQKIAQNLRVKDQNYLETPIAQQTLCQRIEDSLVNIHSNKTLTNDFLQLLRLQEETREVNAFLRQSRPAYDTALFEKIAGESDGPERVEALRKETTTRTQNLESLSATEQILSTQLLSRDEVTALKTLLDSIEQNQRDALRDEFRSLSFWHPVKRLGMEILFLLPLMVAFYMWNGFALRKQRPFQTLVSSHLLVVVFIPLAFKLAELLYDIIPHRLIKTITDLLESLNLIAIWHYLTMFAVVLGALALIYLFQKKIFSRQRLLEKRISKGLCQNCDKRLPIGTHACPFCGFEQFVNCTKCAKPTFKHGDYCRECGHHQNT